MGKVFKPALRRRAIERVLNGALEGTGAAVAEVVEDKKRGLTARITRGEGADEAAIRQKLGADNDFKLMHLAARSGLVDFGAAAGSETVSHFAIFDAASGGTDPAAVRQHFLQQGSSAGAGSASAVPSPTTTAISDTRARAPSTATRRLALPSPWRRAFVSPSRTARRTGCRGGSSSPRSCRPTRPL